MEKLVHQWDPQAGGGQGDWVPADARRFMWYNWLMLLELDGSNDAIRKYAWGLDLAGLAGLLGSAGVSPAGSSGAAGGAVSLDTAGLPAGHRPAAGCPLKATG